MSSDPVADALAFHAKRAALSVERLRELVTYDCETGIFRVRSTRTGYQAGAIAGFYVRGYRWLVLDGIRYPAHQLAWLHHFGAWPADKLDHINRVRDDNRIANLREALQRQNALNRGMNKNNRSGHPGVRQLPSGRYFVEYGRDHRRITVGTFDTFEAAVAAYKEAVAYRGEFAPDAIQVPERVAA